ncbi:hypothetical protein Tsubulata_040230 [Turnera subulata]|uniref:Epidermal patterning factor-like protein n=1 Tax=Turnera subulata TaxID=218843 RepID=A0A9Q0JF82_9ROSI|nr:hypothetical protein Tsubulata_040230 [Turnera subulata]
MGSTQIYFCCHRNTQLIISLLFLLVSGFTLARFVAEGRTITRLQEAAKRGVEEEEAVARTQTIGSKPPRCDRRCNSCGHCEAVQVPISTQAQGHRGSHLWSAAVPRIAYSRGDDVSNYKPMSWKCKCGNLIFNP